MVVFETEHLGDNSLLSTQHALGLYLLLLFDDGRTLLLLLLSLSSLFNVACCHACLSRPLSAVLFLWRW
jgi:hypothetical protein